MSNELKEEKKDIKQEVISEEQLNSSEIIDLFNASFAKKNALRLDKISDLLDDILSKIQNRIDIRYDEFSNKDLVEYLSALIQAAEKSAKLSSTSTITPMVTFNQQNNVVLDSDNILNTLDRDSRVRIANAIEAIIHDQQKYSD